MKIPVPGLDEFTFKQDKEGLFLGVLLFLLVAVLPFTAGIFDKVVYSLKNKINEVIG